MLTDVVEGSGISTRRYGNNISRYNKQNEHDFWWNNDSIGKIDFRFKQKNDNMR
jgi:hypothetical protein